MLKKKYKMFMAESKTTNTVWGDQNREGQSFIRKMVDSLFNNKNILSPKFGKDSTIKNLKSAKYSSTEISKIRKAVIAGMELTIKESKISRNYIEKSDSTLFEMYSFYPDTEYDNFTKANVDILRTNVYILAKQNVNKKLDELQATNESNLHEGLRGENFYYEWDLMNKSEADAIKALKANGFKEYGGGTYRNSTTKEFGDIKQTRDGWKINISDSHGKLMA